MIRTLVDSDASLDGLSVEHALRLWHRGFLPRADSLYDLDAHGPAAYLSARQHYRTGDVNGHWGRMVENKLAAHWLLAPFGDSRQPVHGLLLDGDAIPASRLGPAATADRPTTTTRRTTDSFRGGTAAAEFVRERLAATDRLVLKPVSVVAARESSSAGATGTRSS